MRIKKTVSAALAATLVAAGFLAAVATPAAAEPMGPLVPGDVYLFNAVGTPATLLPSDQILTATKTAGSVNPKSFKTLYIDGVAPADTFQIQPSIRIPQAGVPEDDWVQVPIGAQEGESDGKGGWYLNTTAGDPLVKGELLTWLAAQPNKTGTFPFVVSYCDIDANYLGYARTTITMSLTSADASTYTWTVNSPVWTGGAAPVAADTTVSLGTAVAGHDLTVTATVAPTAAAGTVSFTDNGTPFGSPVAVSNGTAVTTLSAPAAGEHVIGATFTPTDTTAYKASTGSTTVTVAVSGDGSIRLDFVAPAAPLGDPGSVTIQFDTAAAVTLTGQRDSGNTRVTATAALPEITVIDTRRDDLLGGWTVNVQASAFNGGTHGTIGSKYLGWQPATPQITKETVTSPLIVQAGATVPSFLDSTSSTGLSTSQPLATVTTPGRGSTSLKANLNLAVPAADVPAEGTYTSTVTVTLVNN